MTILHVDFESRSACDLKAAGLDNYAKHPTTDVWCMAYAFDDEDVQLWTQASEPRAANHLYMGKFVRDGGLVYAHNAAFELAIWNEVMHKRYGWPVLKPEQVRCTMAMAYAMALPGSLEKAAAAVGLDMAKDMAGHRVMMQFARPKEFKQDWTGRKCPACKGRGDCGECAGTGDEYGDVLVWHDDPAKLEKLYAYCKNDVEVERALTKRLLALPASEQRLWLLDHSINARGVYVDRDAVAAAIAVVESEQARLHTAMRSVTNNAVATCSAVGQLGDWIKSRGVVMPGVAKSDVLDALDGDLPPEVRTALKLRQEAAKSSTAKLKAMHTSTSEDGRLRGMFAYHGASTGRWAGRKVQLHNLPRPKLEQEQIDAVFEILLDSSTQPTEKAALIDCLYGPPLDVISSCLRGFLCAAPGKHLIAVDFANIEGRMLAWLAGEEWKLQAFCDYDAGIGPDLYILTYAKSFGLDPASIPKKDPRRQVGKVEELAFGFGGGEGAWRTMEKAYQTPEMHSDSVQDIKNRWRAAHPRIVTYWYDLEKAAQRACQFPGQVFGAGAAGRVVKYIKKGSFLFCKLPSGRNITYPYPVIKEKETPWGEMKDCIHYMTVDSMTNKWVETSTYGGDQSNHVTQGSARDMLAGALKALEQGYGYDVSMHVHDEAVVEVPATAPEGEQGKVEWVMQQCPLWATGLPIAVEGWRGVRYRKG